MATTTVQELMHFPVLTAGPNDTIVEVFDMMMRRNIRHVPIVDKEQELCGLVTHRDLIQAIASGGWNLADHNQSGSLEGLRSLALQDQPVSSIMTKDPETIAPEESVEQAAAMLLENKFGCLPVVGNRAKVVGILTESDFVRRSLKETLM